MKNNHHIILALDVEERAQALHVLTQLGNEIKYVKVGLQLFTRYGPSIITEIAQLGYAIFLDLKLHDIPNTVASAIKSLHALPIHFLTIHCSGGENMIERAVEAGRSYLPNTLLLGVTVLTSLAERDLASMGIHSTVEDHVLRMIHCAHKSGLRGFVCSPLELQRIRAEFGSEITLVTPGIRPADSHTQDQQRTLAPQEAFTQGASYLVIGRPIMQAKDPRAALREIVATLN